MPTTPSHRVADAAQHPVLADTSVPNVVVDFPPPDADKQPRGHDVRRKPAAGTAVFANLTLLGLSFWFFLGFPYANHNESFAIVAQLRHMSFGEALTEIIYPVANYRPLGQGVAWLGYHWGGSIFPVEVFNYLVAAAAWVLLFTALRERKVFALTALVVGGAFFTGYIYLFHLHGVFYSPMLLLIGALFWLDNDFSRSRFAATSILALVAALFHPYALLIYAAGVAGMAVERRRSLAGHRALIGGALTGGLALFIVLSLSERRTHVRTLTEMLDGLVTSYQMVEINTIVSAAAALLAVVTALSLPGGAKLRYGATIGTVACGLLFIWAGLPVLFLWIALCLVKTVLLKKWWLALVLLCTAAFPAPTATGSPTYAIFVLMVCAAILPYGSTRLEERLGAPARIAAVVTIPAALLLLIPLRLGVDVPVVSTIARPLIAEREKTFQMEEIVSWLLESEYSDYEPMLYREVRNPTDASDSIDRTFRPPTNQNDLGMYVSALRGAGAPPYSASKVVLIGFGGDLLPPGRELLVLPGAAAGEAQVVLPDHALS